MEEVETGRLGRLYKLKRFWKECVRVLRVTKKPDSLEFKTIVKITGIGIIIIGLIGFMIHLIKVMFFG